MDQLQPKMNELRLRLSPIVAYFGKTDYALALAVFATMLSLFTAYKMIRTDQMFGDSAMYLQAVENIAERGQPVSQVSAGIDDGFKDISMPADEIASDPLPLFGHTGPYQERNLFRGHAYLILYPIGLIVRVVPPLAVLMFLYAFSYCGTLLVAYLALRVRMVPTSGAILFCVLIAAHPAWTFGLLSGQFYPDRLFIIFGFALMLLASSTAGAQTLRSRRTWIFVLALLCASINERAAIVAGLFLLSYVGLYWKTATDRYYQLGLGGALFIYGYAALKIVQGTNSEYSSFLPTSFNGLLTLVQGSQFASLNALFFLVNLPFLLFAMVRWRAALIAIFLMLPNVFGNIGGAEKIGWGTHYPSFYFPSLVWAALLGYASLFEKLRASKKLALLSVTALLIFLFAMLNPYSFPPDFKIANAENNVVTDSDYYVRQYILESGTRQYLEDAVAGMRRAVPPHSIVSTVQAGMPVLYQDRIIELFPADIDHADYAVLGALSMGNQVQFGGAVDYLGSTETAKLNDIVLARMKSDNYDLEHPMRFPGYNGLAIVKRRH